jgi:putative transferase (TIGR04331 family)
MKYHLITTNAKINYKNKIFLGHWCKEIKSKINYDKTISKKVIVGRNSAERKAIEKKIIFYEKKIYPKLWKILNYFHNTNKSKKYYSYIIDAWLRRYLVVMLNRYLTINKFLKNNKSKIYDINFEIHKTLKPPIDSLSALEFFDDPKVNDWIYIQALGSFNLNSKVKIKNIKDNKSKKNFKFQKSIINIFYNKLNIIIQKYFSRSDKKFFIGTRMPFLREAIINLYFFQLPKIWKRVKINYSEDADLNLRKKLKNLLISNFSKQQNKEFKFLIKNLLYMMPTSFLENFTNVKNSVLKSYLPKKPDLIFTSNNFDTDDGFKFYLAEQKEKNSSLRYIVGQHGIGYNILSSKTDFPERETADNVLVWGKYKEHKNQIPGFILKSSKINYNKNGKILIICTHLGYRIDYWDTNYFFHKDFMRQISFLDEFKKEFLYQNVMLRLRPYFEKFGFNEKIKIKKKFPKIYIDSSKNINKLYADSRLVIHFYLATTFLETVSNNIPSILFIDEEKHNFNKKTTSLFKSLKKNNILFNDSKMMYEFIDKNFNNLERWWYSKKTQNSLNLFRDNYCRNGKLKDLSNIVKKS